MLGIKLREIFTSLPSILRKWRVLKVGIVLLISYLLWDLMNWIMEDPYKDLDGTVQGIVISTLVVALIAALFKIVDKIDKPVEKDTIDDGDI